MRGPFPALFFHSVGLCSVFHATERTFWAFPIRNGSAMPCGSTECVSHGVRGDTVTLSLGRRTCQAFPGDLGSLMESHLVSNKSRDRRTWSGLVTRV